jgi:xanthine dehydrogenase accessory factor|tara:strand:+ start:1188 stop:2027 length:840 start_codon:yes stop_codon:yes gene_type:complete
VTKVVLSWIIDRLEAGDRVAVASVVKAQGSVPGKPGARMAISSKGGRFGTVGGAGLELKIEKILEEMLCDADSYSRKKGGRVEVFLLNKDGKGKEVTTLDSICGGRVTVAMEVIYPTPHILIVGGGHVGFSIAKVCDNLDWSYSVFDIREEYCNPERFPHAADILCSTVEEFLQAEDEEALQRFSDILLLSHDWGVDEDLLIGLLGLSQDTSRPRIGAIGSKKKWSEFERAAIENGIEKRLIDAVRCPIGLDIGADSPEEIAVSVCAEVLSLERAVNPT